MTLAYDRETTVRRNVSGVPQLIQNNSVSNNVDREQRGEFVETKDPSTSGDPVIKIETNKTDIGYKIK